MEAQLPPADEEYLEDLLTWDRHRRRGETAAAYGSLVLGALLLVGAMVTTALDLRDAVVRSVLLPGVLGGLLLLVVFVLGRGRIRDRHRMACIARKLSDAT